MNKRQEIDIVCSGAGGRPYDGDHRLFANHYMIIEPNGTVKRFCDSDCLREHYAFLWQQFKEQLAREHEELVSYHDEQARRGQSEEAP